MRPLLNLLSVIGVAFSIFVVIVALGVISTQFGGEEARDEAVQECIESYPPTSSVDALRDIVVYCREYQNIERFTLDAGDVWVFVLSTPIFAFIWVVFLASVGYLQESYALNQNKSKKTVSKKKELKRNKDTLELFSNAPYPGEQESGKAHFDKILHDLIIDLRRAKNQKKLPPRKAYQTAEFLRKKLEEEDGYYTEERADLWHDVASYLEENLKKVFSDNPELAKKRRLL